MVFMPAAFRSVPNSATASLYALNALMKPVMKRLADAGQKAITCSLIDEAWNAQTYDWFPPMIEWVKGKNGTMRWNYANFDKWVSFMMNEVGVKGQISC